MTSTNHNHVCHRWWLSPCDDFQLLRRIRSRLPRLQLKGNLKRLQPKKLQPPKKQQQQRRKLQVTGLALIRAACCLRFTFECFTKSAGQSWTVLSCHLVKQQSIMEAFSKPKASSATGAPSFDSSDSEAEVKVLAKKVKAASKRKQADSDDSDSDSDNLMARLKAKAVGSKASVTTELWSESMSLMKGEGSLWSQIAAERFVSSRNPRSASLTKPSVFLTRKHPSRWRHATTPRVHGNPSSTI